MRLCWERKGKGEESWESRNVEIFFPQAHCRRELQLLQRLQELLGLWWPVAAEKAGARLNDPLLLGSGEGRFPNLSIHDSRLPLALAFRHHQARCLLPFQLNQISTGIKQVKNHSPENSRSFCFGE